MLYTTLDVLFILILFVLMKFKLDVEVVNLVLKHQELRVEDLLLWFV